MIPASSFQPGSRTDAGLGASGVIPVRGLLGDVLRELGVRLVGGQWASGETIPKDSELQAAFGVSRSVIREALRTLGAKGMIRSRTSDGTRVLPRENWRLLDPDVIDWRIRAGDVRPLLTDLLKVRKVMEPGFVHEATLLAGDADRAAVSAAWAAKVAVFENPSDDHAARRAAFIETDLVFHRAILSILGSELLDQLFGIIDAALRLLMDLQMRARGYTREMVGMDESHELHERVFEAFVAGDAEAACGAMRVLIQRAIDDAEQGFTLLSGEGG